MKIITASEIMVGTKYKSGSSIQEVTNIVKVSDKAVEFRTKRIAPDYYDDGIGFFQRKNLKTKICTY